uniref:alpha-galactosidase n=1 Tax=Strombidium rassoulzadegani TaxID=1082188 RepID=A0A7S3FU54_9SPIT|mmetsp:Transcript_14917/g.25413  ORF Transcript_14917/g.25413 Transcript_14917/m.25413 type:complete len:180 (+) Transcript_14917:716-1255(+)
MLEVGNCQMTNDEEKTHFALWALAKSPMIIGCDLTKVSKESLSILMNKDLIAVNQDPASTQAKCMIGCNYWDTILRRPSVWQTKLSTGEVVVAVVNWRENNWKNYKFYLTDVGLAPKDGDSILVRDLIEQKEIGSFVDSHDRGSVSVDSIPGHGSKVFKFTVVPSEVSTTAEEPVFLAN